MKEYNNQCVGCPPEKGCLGESCPYRNTVIYYCDRCNSDEAEFQIDGEELCEKCTEEYLRDMFDELSLYEKAEAVGINVTEIGD